MVKDKNGLPIEKDTIGILDAYIIDELQENSTSQEYGYTMPPQFRDSEYLPTTLDREKYPTVIIIDL